VTGDRLARFVRATLGRLVLAAFRTRITGAENIPHGAAMLAGNHVSYMDPVLLWCASPRPVHFMAKSELWESRFLGWLLSRLLAFPVRRGEPDRTAISTATTLLTSGEVVGVFPEGTRQFDTRDALGAAQGGAAFIALRADAPVVPVAFVGTDRVWPKGARLPRLARTFIFVGSPVYPGDILPEGGRKERVGVLTDQIMGRISELLDRSKEAAV